jgi:rRNA maturation endonuclease Nob1
MIKPNVGNAFSAGIGLAMGFTMAQYMFQALKPPEKILKQVIICLKCGSKNPSENRFCGQCGQALYPPPPIQCPRCSAIMPSNMKFCGRCGSPLRKTSRIRKKRS